MKNHRKVNIDVCALGVGGLGRNIMAHVLLSSVFGLLIGCGNSVETDPKRILPVLKQAQRCCDGRCSGFYEGISRDVACVDVWQMESCLKGRREDCPLRDHGAF